MALPKVHSFRVHTMLHAPAFQKEIGRTVKIIDKYDVPYVAGYSKDGKDIYIDRHLNVDFNGTDITKYLLVHERVEKALIDVFGLRYQEAHHIALAVEHDAVVGDGINWRDYSKFIDKYIKRLDHENLKLSPPNLDLTPYEDEKDFSKFVKKRSYKYD